MKKQCGMTTCVVRHSYAQVSIDAGIMPEVVTKMPGQKTSRTVWTCARIRDQQIINAASHLRLRTTAEVG